MSQNEVQLQRLFDKIVAYSIVQAILSFFKGKLDTHSNTDPMAGMSAVATEGYTCEITVGSDVIMTGGAVTTALFATALKPCVAVKEPLRQ